MTSMIIVELSLIISQLQSNKDKRKHGDRIMHCTSKKSLQYSQKFKLIQILTVNVWEKLKVWCPIIYFRVIDVPEDLMTLQEKDTQQKGFLNIDLL